jgi:ATP-dependent helicase/nuclease subunit B
VKDEAANEIDEWLCGGKRVLAASERAARAIAAEYHRRRRGEGLAGWAAPDVVSWTAFVRAEWERRQTDGRLLLNPAQEEALWAGIIRESEHSAGLLEGPLRRLAGLCMEAHELLCAYAPRYLERPARGGWQQDAGAFSEWLAGFDAECRSKKLISASRISGELAAALEDEVAADRQSRPALMLAGFDRMTPEQRSVTTAWGEARTAASAEPASERRYFAAPDQRTELTACAAWCAERLAANPEARLLVITQDASQRRGEIERAFLRAGVQHEFSLGVRLAGVGLARSALLILRWLDGALAENEIDWLFSADWITGSEERAALQAYCRGLRRKGWARTEWTLEAFLRAGGSSLSVPESWARRMQTARQRLRESAGLAPKGASERQHSPLEWAGIASLLLKDAGWAGTRAATSAEFQAVRRWEQTLDACGSLGFDGRRMDWLEFLAELRQAASETLFALESEDAPVLIAGPAESAGLTADAIWFLGADEDAWPARGSGNPLLPVAVQREAGMPHATAELDHELAATVTRRLLGSAADVRFSYARLKDDVEVRASRLVAGVAGSAQLLAEPRSDASSSLRAEQFVDTARIPLRGEAGRAVSGGSGVLTAQSLCGFQAFAKERLAAQGWQLAEDGLTPPVRGKLLHAALSGVWGASDGIRTLEELKSLDDLESFAAPHVRRAMEKELPRAVREEMPARYLELEETRLRRLVAEWLRYETNRLDFTVLETEAKAEVEITGLSLDVRLDRLDWLNDGTKLVIDYKTGEVSPREWDTPRPEDVQLPLYAEFALGGGSAAVGLVFARVQPGEMKFAGKVRNPLETLSAELSKRLDLVRKPLTDADLAQWRAEIERLARDFLDGRADVDPRELPKTCMQCGLQALCRVHETAARGAEDTDE